MVVLPRVEKHDINEGLERFNGQFDVVNARLIASGMRYMATDLFF